MLCAYCSYHELYCLHMCTKTFRQKNHLTQHKLTHAGEMPFMCYICKKTFAAAATMKKHVLTHAGGKT